MGFLYDGTRHQRLAKEGYDCILWTFTKDRRITANPQAWGYAVLEPDGKTIKGMSVKAPISETPSNDHVVAATFWLRSKKILYEAIRKMMAEGIKTNNEYYLDNLPLALKLLGRRSAIFDVDFLIGWGTPQEFFEFDRIRHFHRLGKLAEAGLSPAEQQHWKEYFGRDAHG
jgi:hypothetical protein